jgi:hypothetical protein
MSGMWGTFERKEAEMEHQGGGAVEPLLANPPRDEEEGGTSEVSAFPAASQRSDSSHPTSPSGGAVNPLLHFCQVRVLFFGASQKAHYRIHCDPLAEAANAGNESMCSRSITVLGSSCEYKQKWILCIRFFVSISILFIFWYPSMLHRCKN